MLIERGSAEQGDTLIEVIVALAVFAIVTVSAFAIVNKGAAQMYDSLERTQVRMLMDQQTESLIYSRDQYLRSQSPSGAAQMASEPENTAAGQAWEDITAVTESTPDMDECNGDASTAFYFTRSGTSIQLTRFSSTDSAVAGGAPYAGSGLYIQYRNSLATVPVKYKDFYVHACWQPTSSQVRQVVSTVVRLYEN